MPNAPVSPVAIDDGGVGIGAWAMILFGAAVLVVSTYLTAPGVFQSIDWLRIHVFYKEYFASAIRHGRMPLWNPQVALGRPFLADVDSVVFYPPSLAYLVLDVRAACALGIWLHLSLGLFGMLKLGHALGMARPARWATAFVFMASAPIVGSFSSGLINYGAALCYIPLIFFLLLRMQDGRSLRRAAALALVLGFQLLAGHPQATWLTCFGGGLLLAGRSLGRPVLPAVKALAVDFGVFAAAVLVAAAMVAVVLLPLAELSGQSNRHASTLAFASSFAMTPLAWLTLACPNDPHTPVMANAQLYAGVAVFLAAPFVLLAWREWRARSLALLALAAGLVAAGRATPAFAVLYHLLPGLAQFRIPSRATVLFTLALVLAAGIALSQPRPRRLLPGLALAVLAALAAGFATGTVIEGFGGPAHRTCALVVSIRQGILVLLAAGLLALWWYRDRFSHRRLPALLAGALALLSAVDLYTASLKLRRENIDVAADLAQERVARAMRAKGLFGREGVPPRIALPRLVFENSGMRYGWSSFTGYASMMLGRVWHYIHAGVGLEVPTEQVAYPAGPILGRGPFAYDSMALVVGAEPGTERLLVNGSADPRAYVATAAIRVADYREATARMRDGHPFHEVALLERDPPAGMPAFAGPAAAARAAIASFAPERLVVEVESERPGLLILAEPWFPGWSARVNGRPAECFPANAWMRAIPVPAGRSQVVMTYRSTYLVLGAALSLGTFALLLAALLFRRSRCATR